jgi:GST-like protein
VLSCPPAHTHRLVAIFSVLRAMRADRRVFKSIAVEAALTLLGVPYSLVEGATWAEASARERVAPQNPMRQVPTLVLPDGEVMTESAAILLYLADAHQHSRLAPSTSEPLRRQYLRWMVYVSSAIYSLHWIEPDVRRIGAPLERRDAVVNAVHDRIAFCWSSMDAQLNPGSYLLGDQLTVLDLYVTVVSRFGFAAVALRRQPARRPTTPSAPRATHPWLPRR